MPDKTRKLGRGCVLRYCDRGCALLAACRRSRHVKVFARAAFPRCVSGESVEGRRRRRRCRPNAGLALLPSEHWPVVPLRLHCIGNAAVGCAIRHDRLYVGVGPW